MAILIPPWLGAARRRDAPSVGFHRVEEARHPRPSCCEGCASRPSEAIACSLSRLEPRVSCDIRGAVGTAVSGRRNIPAMRDGGNLDLFGNAGPAWSSRTAGADALDPPPGCFPGGTCTPRTAATSCLNRLTATASSTAAGAPCGRASPPTRPAAALSGKRRTISWFATTSTPAHVGRADADPRLVVRQGSPVCRSASTRCQALRAAIRTGSHTGENGGA